MAFLHVVAGLAIAFTTLFFWVARQCAKMKPRGARKGVGDVDAMEDEAVARRRWTKKKAASLGEVDVIVIGGGIGGLTTASLLAGCGYRVAVLEMHDRLGGCTHVFDWTKPAEDAGFEGESVRCEFDSGYHYTTGLFADPTSRTGAILRTVCDGNVEFNDLGDPYDRVLFPAAAPTNGAPPAATQGPFIGDEVTFVRGPRLPAHLAAQLTSGHPATTALLEARLELFYATCLRAASTAGGVFGARVLPAALGRGLEAKATAAMAKYGHLSTGYVIKAMLVCGFSEAEVLAEKPLPEGLAPRVDGQLPATSDLRAGSEASADPELPRVLRRLQAVMVHPLGDYGAQPQDSSFLAHSFVIDYYRRGSSYPASSAQGISAGMARVVLRGGGDVLCNARVESIIRDEQSGRALGVRVKSRAAPASAAGVEMFARHGIVNGAGIHHLYRPGGLLGDKTLTAQVKAETKFVPSCSHMYLFVTLRGTPEELNLPKTNLWCLSGAGQGANDIDGAFDAYNKTPGDPATPPPAVYITFPSAKEDQAEWSRRNPGISNAIVFCDAEYAAFEQWAGERIHNRSADYEAFKESVAKHLFNVLWEKRPDLKSKVVWSEVGTPLTSEYYLGAFRGGDYGTRVDTNYFDATGLKWLMTPTTPVPGLFQSGQDAMTPSISGAMHGGVLCAWRMLGLLGMARSVASVMAVQYAAARRVLGDSVSTPTVLWRVLATWRGARMSCTD